EDPAGLGQLHRRHRVELAARRGLLEALRRAFARARHRPGVTLEALRGAARLQRLPGERVAALLQDLAVAADRARLTVDAALAVDAGASRARLGRAELTLRATHRLLRVAHAHDLARRAGRRERRAGGRRLAGGRRRGAGRRRGVAGGLAGAGAGARVAAADRQRERRGE